MPTHDTTLRHHTTRVNDITMHYVEAGGGEPVVLLHGWGQTSHMWTMHVMPALARDYHVIAPDLRGSGYSEKPLSGYDKRTMAEDVHALVTTLGYDSIKLVSHDLGGAVAYAYAVTFQAEVEKAAFFEILVPGFGGLEGRLGFPFPTDAIGRQVWHMTFHNAPYGVPEFLIQGREREYLDYFWNNFADDPTAVTEEERVQCARCYAAPGGLHSLKYYRTLAEDAAYNAAAAPLKMPVLAYGGSAFLGEKVKANLEAGAAEDVRGGVIPDCGHWVTAEQPQFVIDSLREFFAE